MVIPAAALAQLVHRQTGIAFRYHDLYWRKHILSKKIACIGALLALVGTGAVSARTTQRDLSIAPSAAVPSATYVFDFQSNYGGYGERYDGTLVMRRRGAKAVVISGKSSRRLSGVAASSAVPSHHISQPFTATRRDAFAALKYPSSQLGVADLLFDYNSLLALLPQNARERSSANRWVAATPCWVSDKVFASIPVLVTVSRDGNRRRLAATGHAVVPVSFGANAMTASVTVSFNAVFDNDTLQRATMNAHESYQRAGMPAGGGSYGWVVAMKGATL